MRNVKIKLLGNFNISDDAFKQLSEKYKDVVVNHAYIENTTINYDKNFEDFMSSDKTIYLEQVEHKDYYTDGSSLNYHVVAVKEKDCAFYACDEFIYFEGSFKNLKQYLKLEINLEDGCWGNLADNIGYYLPYNDSPILVDLTATDLQEYIKDYTTR